MRVGHLTSSLSREGAGVYESVKGLAKACQARGVSVQAFGVTDGHTAEDAAGWSPVPTQAFGVVGTAKIGYSRGLGAALQRFSGADALIHMHGIWGVPLSLALSRWRRSGGRCVISPHGMLDPWALRLSRRRKHMALWLYERDNLTRSACLHAASEAELEAIRQFGLRGPAVLVPNGVDLPSEHPEGVIDPVPTEWRGRRVLLYLGRLHPKKGLVALVESWSRVSPRWPSWRLAIVGPGEGGHDREIASLVRARAATATVRLVGPQYGKAKDSWLRRADAFVLPSYSEGCPIAVLEAMAYGKAVIVTPYCNVPAAVEEGAAIASEPTVPELTGGLTRMLGLPDEERIVMGQRGRRIVERRYTWPAVAEKLLAVYRWVLGAGPVPDGMMTT